MSVFLHGFGGKGLNFRVKAYATESDLLASEPTRNTIGVIGESTKCRVVDKLPEIYDPGIVYILTGSAGTVELTADNICLHPMEVWQDGNSLDGWIYQDGWVQFAQAWDKYYFRDGEQYENITGGWVKTSTTGTVKIRDTLEVESTNASAPATVSTAKKIDLTGVNTLFFDSPNGRDGNFYGAYLRIATDSKIVRDVQFAAVGQGSIDVSDLTGEYYIILHTVGGGNGSGYGDIRAIWRD